MKVESREYKLLVNHEPFADSAEAVKAVWDEIEEAARTLPMVQTKSKLDEKETRHIIFLDTPDHTLRRNGLDWSFASEPLTNRRSTPLSADLRTAISRRGPT